MAGSSHTNAEYAGAQSRRPCARYARRPLAAKHLTPVAADAGEMQPCAGVRAYSAGNDPHARRPRRFRRPPEVGHLRSGPGQAAAVSRATRGGGGSRRSLRKPRHAGRARAVGACRRWSGSAVASASAGVRPDQVLLLRWASWARASFAASTWPAALLHPCPWACSKAAALTGVAAALAPIHGQDHMVRRLRYLSSSDHPQGQCPHWLSSTARPSGSSATTRHPQGVCSCPVSTGASTQASASTTRSRDRTLKLRKKSPPERRPLALPGASAGQIAKWTGPRSAARRTGPSPLSSSPSPTSRAR